MAFSDDRLISNLCAKVDNGSDWDRSIFGPSGFDVRLALTPHQQLSNRPLDIGSNKFGRSANRQFR